MNFKHGFHGMPEYLAWRMMIARCHRAAHIDYPEYGGRGILVCQEWREDFRSFFQHIGSRPSADHSLDRIENSRGYEPGNVRWATAKEQALNRRKRRQNPNSLAILKPWEAMGICRKTWYKRGHHQNGTRAAAAQARSPH